MNLVVEINMLVVLIIWELFDLFGLYYLMMIVFSC